MKSNINLRNLAKIYFLILFCNFTSAYGQSLGIKEAIDKGVSNYGLVVAKSKYAEASRENIAQVKSDYLPNINLSAQQDYGTINGQNGPLYGLGGLGVASSGIPLSNQNWNASFGALYLVNVNWEFFTFGRMKQRINVAKADAERYQKDYDQELFQHKVRISSAYLNLLASQRILISQSKNLERAKVFHHNVSEKVKNGLLPGVDATTASAEVSRAKIALNLIKEQVKIQNNELVQLMGIEPVDFATDTTFINKVPIKLVAKTAADTISHLTRQYFRSRIIQSKEQEKLFRKEFLPSFTLFGIYQTRASGFNADYAVDQTSYTRNYFDGITPTRQNYLFGVGLVWNLTTIARSNKKTSSQKLITEGLEAEYKAIDLELRAREDVANARIEFALQNFNEAPIQVSAAKLAYLQRLTLYNNGLTTFTDATTALFTLNRAETDKDIAFTNVWQALLLKAAATGDFNLFINEF
ncbi:TolC family protein [Flavobacterium sp. XS2P39]|uniref:TolC family protein n=1 Tax=Flavobacterium sp. XS2P39 TaxID=3401725 RepID=UPI003AACFEBA